ncbi:hypothetical protein PAXINDRAFT_181881 [Paxillus involutus ATCC 200175]|uniref:Protein kinase domain-containing protein n=1 Tax=Paxillus involutus ATCC 200175 TaxID=664439 RepID=A0A0C9T697_PAXIN|nr:hypothetical protein PAXINDRAFT_181881 [Paxillus involutus ATCC 200175]
MDLKKSNRIKSRSFEPPHNMLVPMGTFINVHGHRNPDPPYSPVLTRKVAVKSVKIPSMETSAIEKVTKVIRREVSVWVTLSHRNILPLYGLTSGLGHLPCLVSPWMENGSLKDYSVNPGLPDDAGSKLAMVYKIADGLKYLHDKGIVHGNLVDTNVLIDDFGEPCITDFGLSIILKEQENATFNTSFVANVRWSAPELLFSVETVWEYQEDAPISKPTKAGDLYSFGCIMAYVLFGGEPYASIPSAPAVIRAKINDIAPYPLDSKIGSIYSEFMRQCWASDHTAQPSIDAVLQFVKSPPDLTPRVERIHAHPVAQGHYAEVHQCRLRCRSGPIYVALKVIKPANADPHMPKKLEIRGVACGLQYLHSSFVVHGDLSGCNVLVGKDQTARLTDFGLSTLLTGSRVSSSLIQGGSARWSAPERLVGATIENVVPEPLKEPTPQTDTYSFGRIMLQVFEGKVPYYYLGGDAEVIFYVTRGVHPCRPTEPTIDDQDWVFIQRCWNRDPGSRPSDEDIIAFVEAHPYSLSSTGSANRIPVHRSALVGS